MKTSAFALAVALSGAGQALASTANVDVDGMIYSLPEPFLGSFVYGSIPYSTGTINAEDSDDHGGYVSVEYADGGAGYSAQAYAEYGAVHASISTQPSEVSTGLSRAFANVVYGDWFVITGGSGEGQAALSANLEGSLAGAQQASFVRVSFNVRYQPASSCPECGPSYSSQQVIDAAYGTDDPQPYTFGPEPMLEYFYFTYGEPFMLTTVLEVEAYQGAWADFFSTGTLVGFTLPTGASLYSASGTYLVSGVPEPETYAMMLAGLGLMGGVIRRRRLPA